MGKGLAAALAVLAAALSAPALAEEPPAGTAVEKLERVCGWVDGPEAFDPRVLEGDEDTLAKECRTVLACFLEARRAPAAGSGAVAGSTDVETICRVILALTPEEIRGFVESSEAVASAAKPCVEFLRCLSWRDEFARICGRTEDAASLPREEIEELLRESEALLDRVAGLGIPEAKIYTFRLEKCRAFFEYALELQESRGREAAAGDG